MANHPTEAAYRKTPRILQFRLWTIFVAMAAVAVLAALAKFLGNDGLFLGSIGVPLITGLVLIRGPIGRKLALSVAGTLIVHGITWQGQRTLSAFSCKDLHQVVNVPAGHATLHDVALFAWMLLDQA